ncbi:MAG: hypothetical protein K6T94_18345 [Paenibacillus sp.]|nr:hypothetical protein [Paenibacillus sp.]
MNMLDDIPEPKKLMDLLQILASLNIVLCPKDEWLRYHSYVPEWDKNISMAKIDNGAGDHLFILFAPQGILMKGFDHESELSPHARDEFEIWPGIYEEVPIALSHLLEDEAIEKEDVTFCIWRETKDFVWRMGTVEIPEGEEDGSSFLLGTIHETAEDFVDFAEGYFEMSLPLDIVKKIYEGAPITTEMIRMLNHDCDADKVLQELESLRLL